MRNGFVCLKSRKPIDHMESNQIKLECPHCKASKIVTRFRHDPPSAVTIQTVCPQCHVPGGFESVTYLNKDGAEVRLEHSED